MFRYIFLSILLTVLIIFCDKTPQYSQSAYNNNTVINAIIYVNSTDNPNNLLNSNKVWKSLFPQDILIYIKFSKKIFISQMKIDIWSKSQVKNIFIFSQNKFTKSAQTNIQIEDSTDFVIIHILTEKKLTYVAADSTYNYYLSLSTQYNPLIIKDIEFYNQNEKYKIIPLRKTNGMNYSNFNTLKNRNIIYQDQKQKFIMFYDSVGNIILYSKKDSTINFLFGTMLFHIETALYDKIIVKGLLFTYKDKKMTIKNYDNSLKISYNKLIINEFIDIPIESLTLLQGDELVEVSSLDTSLIFDIRYSTENNFAKQKFYPCAVCLLRYKVAQDLISANKDFMTQGYRLVVYDCYRPYSVQVKMWNIVYNKNYVAPPDVGSSHNRGSAVDLSLYKINGDTVDMGTGYDYFGKEAFPDYSDLPANVLNNRKILQQTLMKHNFRPIKTEWWHFYHVLTNSYAILDYPLPCKK